MTSTNRSLGASRRRKTRLQRLEEAARAAAQQQNRNSRRSMHRPSLAAKALVQLPPKSPPIRALSVAEPFYLSGSKPFVDSDPAFLPSASPSPRPPQRRSRPVARRPRLRLLIGRAVVLSVSLGLVVGGISQALRAVLPSDSQLPPPATSPSTSAPLLESGSPLLAQKNPDLEQRLTQLAARSGLAATAMFVDVASGEYADLNGTDVVPAASVIKVPVLVAFWQAIDAGEIQLNDKLPLRPDLMAGGSGVLQFGGAGREVTALTAATLMITVSDNTATNLLIDRLGGIEMLNQKFAQWGLQHTRFAALLPDLEGTNTTSALDMTSLLNQIEQGKLISRRSRDRMLDIMRRTETRTLLPRGLDNAARIAHKTGNIRSLVGDVGIIDMPNGRRYIAAALVRRNTPNDRSANELIAQMSALVYKYWSTPSPSATPDPG